MSSESKSKAAGSDDAGATLERYDIALVEHFARWLPFGGPSAQTVFEEFGISLETACARVLKLIEPKSRARVHLGQRERLSTVAGYRATLVRNLHQAANRRL